MTLLKGWKLTLMAGMALASANGQAFAQKPGSFDPNVLGGGNAPTRPASFVMQGPSPEQMQFASANMGMGPEGMAMPGAAPGYDPAMGGNPEEFCTECGGVGERTDCDPYGRSWLGLAGGLRSRVASHRGMLRPYGEGGIATQRWFDLSGETMILGRSRGADNFNTTSLGANSNNFVLGTDQVDLNKLRAGLSLQANLQTGVGSNVEFAYFGLNNWNETATVTSSTANLYSFISRFGVLPAGGFDDSDRSLSQSLNYQSEFHNAEVNFRRRWAEPNGFFQGSWLGGLRYFELEEDLHFSARGLNNNGAANNGPRFFDYGVGTHNNLFGVQVGGDLWYNLIPGVKLGSEIKTGIYNNRSRQGTTLVANSLVNAINESALDNRTASITQYTNSIVYRLNYSWTFKGSYQFLYIDNVALAPEQFNAAPPAVFLPNQGRTVTINNKQDVVYQGFSLGAEYTW